MEKKTPLLEIRNLHVVVEDKPILRGVNLTIYPGEVHSIMGPNGSGKSTLAYVLAGKEGYEVTEGEILYNGKDLLEMEPDERAAEGGVLGVPVSCRDSRGQQHLLPSGGGQRDSEVPWRAGD